MDTEMWDLLYIADKKDGHEADDFIDNYTAIFNRKLWKERYPDIPYPHYSHAEKVFPYRARYAEWIERHCGIVIPVGNNICFSSTLRDEGKGVRFADFDIITRNKHRWDLYLEIITEEEMDIRFARACKIVGRPYFKIGLVLDFGLPFGKLGWAIGALLNQWYCSQACFYVDTGKRARQSPIRRGIWIRQQGRKFLGNLGENEVNYQIINDGKVQIQLQKTVSKIVATDCKGRKCTVVEFEHNQDINQEILEFIFMKTLIYTKNVGAENIKSIDIENKS